MNPRVAVVLMAPQCNFDDVIILQPNIQMKYDRGNSKAEKFSDQL